MSKSMRQEQGFNFFRSIKVAFQTSAAGGIIIGLSALWASPRQSAEPGPESTGSAHVVPHETLPQTRDLTAATHQHFAGAPKTRQSTEKPAPGAQNREAIQASKEKQAYNRFIHHLYDREGCRDVVYRDSEGVLTVGVGHKVCREDNLNAGKKITKQQILAFLEHDARKAFDAAKMQAAELRVADHSDFVAALASVNFQLGTKWYTIHQKTWGLMKQGRFAEAAAEAADSKWNSQTPTRVRDFQEALNKLAEDLRSRKVSWLTPKFGTESAALPARTAQIIEIVNLQKGKVAQPAANPMTQAA